MSKRELKSLQKFTEERIESTLVWIQIESTEGSTYRKQGAIKLVDASGQSQGLLSGGCLEKEIEKFAFNMQDPIEHHSFQTLQEEDRLFGYGLGCQGVIHLKFEQLQGCEIIERLKSLQKKFQFNLAVIGAGPDLDPLRDLCLWMQWNLQFFSDQSDRVEERRHQGWSIDPLTQDSLLDFCQPHQRSAVLLMSHRYPTDLEVLSWLSKVDLPYIGILGPAKRKEQMLQDLKKVYDLAWPHARLACLHGPVGLSGLGHGEDAIALSVIAQLQEQFFSKSSL